MKPKWEMLTGWKVNLVETEVNSLEYFNEKSLIPGHIYRIHVLNGAPIIVEFKQFGYGYNYSMTETYPRMLICDGAAVVPIEDVTHIFAYNIDDEDDKDASSESVKTTTDVSGFKDFVVSEYSYHVNEKLRGIQTVSGLCSDKINISGELKITGFGKTMDDSPCLCAQGIYIELPTGDEIFVPLSYHPWVKSGQDSLRVFTESEPELSWHKDLVAGDFYIMLNRFGEKKLILIKYILNDKIEYDSCNSRYDRNNSAYFVESVKHELMMTYAKDYKFIPLKDIMC